MSPTQIFSKVYKDSILFYWAIFFKDAKPIGWTDRWTDLQWNVIKGVTAYDYRS